MSARTHVLVLSAHPDDWQIFAGPAVYEHLRDPQTQVCVIDLTAGDAGDDERYWKARHSGAVSALLRGLPTWSPYPFGDLTAATLPSGFSVSYEPAPYAGKTLLRTSVRCGDREAAQIVSLHLPDGRADGAGFAPAHQSMLGLREGRCVLRPLWPPGAPDVYTSWDELIATLRAIVAASCEDARGRILIYAPNGDAIANPGDHADHAMAALAAEELRAANPALRLVRMSMYANAARPENLDERAGALQRAAIVAYASGYAATVAGTGGDWRRGWERELEAYKNRQYLESEAP